MTEEQFAKLPKWAQKEIAYLRRAVESQTERIAQLCGKPSLIKVGYGRDMMGDSHPQQYLGDGEHVRFQIGPSADHDWIDVSLRDDGIDVSGQTAVAILPMASNHLEVKLVKP